MPQPSGREEPRLQPLERRVEDLPVAQKSGVSAARIHERDGGSPRAKGDDADRTGLKELPHRLSALQDQAVPIPTTDEESDEAPRVSSR